MAKCIQCGRELPALTFGRKICQWCVRHEAAQRGQLGEDEIQPVMDAPWTRRESSVSLTKIIFSANAMVFIAMVVASGPSLDFTGKVMIQFGANFGPFTLSGQWWRLFTYMFLHGGIWHIAMNMWCLWNLGELCESLYGPWTYAAIYGITGVAGGLASVGWNPNVLSVGASGALFGLTGALIASFALGEFSFSGLPIRSTLTSLLFFAGFTLFIGGTFSGIDNACHIGGLVSGLIFGALIALVAPDRDKPFQRSLVVMFVVLLVAGSGAAVRRVRGYGPGFSAALQAQQGLERMIGDLQKKAEQNPQDPSAHYALAHAYFNRGQFSNGEIELERVLVLDPTNAKARMDLGAAYLSTDQPKEAQAEFTTLVTQNPNNANAHVGLGVALADQNNHPAAIAEFNTALRIDPNAHDVHYRLGFSQLELKQYDDAIASLTKERDVSGDNADIENALADAYEGKGMQKQAQDARERASQLPSGGRD